jgi:hypothetical protein
MSDSRPNILVIWSDDIGFITGRSVLRTGLEAVLTSGHQP